MTDYELEQDIKEMHEILRKQRERIMSSKEEAEKLLNRLGIMHLLVPAKKYRFRPRKTSRVKSSGKLKAANR